jgi:hypothetical protein
MACDVRLIPVRKFVCVSRGDRYRGEDPFRVPVSVRSHLHLHGAGSEMSIICEIRESWFVSPPVVCRPVERLALVQGISRFYGRIEYDVV